MTDLWRDIKTVPIADYGELSRESEEVLLAYEDGCVGFGTVMFSNISDEQVTFSRSVNPATHWMPLPDPPVKR